MEKLSYSIAGILVLVLFRLAFFNETECQDNKRSYLNNFDRIGTCEVADSQILVATNADEKLLLNGKLIRTGEYGAYTIICVQSERGRYWSLILLGTKLIGAVPIYVRDYDVRSLDEASIALEDVENGYMIHITYELSWYQDSLGQFIRN